MQRIMHIRWHIYVSKKCLLAYETPRVLGREKNIHLYLHRLVRACLEATYARLHIGVGRPSYPESTEAGTAWLPHDTTRHLVQVSVNRTHYAGGKAWHRWNGTIPKTAAE